MGHSYPDNVYGKGDGSSLNLLASKKSREACEIRNMIKEQMQKMKRTGTMMRHFEAESDNIKVGQKYQLSMGSGQSGGLWIRKTDNDNLRISMCRNGEPMSRFTVEGTKDGGASKGSMIMKHSFSSSNGETSFATNYSYDRHYSNPDRTKVLSRSKFSNSNGGGFRSLVAMDLSKEGVSYIKGARNGTFGGATFDNTGAARIDPDFGMALLKMSHDGDESWEGPEPVGSGLFVSTLEQVSLHGISPLG